jgi:hypothetical protein
MTPEKRVVSDEEIQRVLDTLVQLGLLEVRKKP